MDVKSILLLCILYIFTSQLQAKIVVKIHQGLVEGTILKTSKGRDISAFLGIQYGQSPTGKLRFSSPLPVEPWDGVFLANKEPTDCPQELNGKISGIENCLTLNVFTPILEFNCSESSAKLLPVMVYIHGGGYSKEGIGLSDYSPKYFVDKDIVFVTMNYRLGILGFFSTGDSVAPGNFGLKDQLLALKWVKQNAHVFGGDANRVTLFGNSAGAYCVHLLSLSDAANGLFHQYILQSGTVFANRAYQRRTEFQPAIKHIAQAVNCSNINSKVLTECLRGKSFNELLRAMIDVKDMFPRLIWVPTDEEVSKDAILTDSPLNILAQNKIKDLPFITGSQTNEGLMATIDYYADASMAVNAELIDYFIDNTSAGYYSSPNVKNFKKIIESYYFNGPNIFADRKKLLDNITMFLTDSGFSYPEVILLQNMAKLGKRNKYMYNFGYRGSVTLYQLKTNNTNNYGVAHADELLYIYPMSNTVPRTKDDQYIGNLIIDLWTSFATNGIPISCELDDPNLWLPYNKNGNYLQIGNIKYNVQPSVTIEKGYNTDRMNFWRENFPLP